MRERKTLLVLIQEMKSLKGSGNISVEIFSYYPTKKEFIKDKKF